MSSQFRHHFPYLHHAGKERPLIYLDSAATTQKPSQTIAALSDFYVHNNANVHRGIYQLSERATLSYEKTRHALATFIKAKKPQEIVFVRGTTEAINLVAATYGYANFGAKAEIIVSTMEHHSNIVPWQLISAKTGAKLKIIEINEAGELDLEHYAKLLTKHTKMVALTHVSNSLGTINPVKAMIAMAHAYHVPVLLDGAQAVAHLPVDVQDLDCDFYTFSAHKMYGPTGIGVLYGKEQLLEAMPPYHGGGNMIKTVTFAKTTYADLPQKFEAGTQNIAAVVALGATLDFITTIGIDTITHHDQELLTYATSQLLAIKGLKIVGTAKEKVGIISFILDKVHPHDVATILDTEGIAVRAGHHCTMPLMDFYGIAGTTRVSFGLYNTKAEIDLAVTAIDKASKIFTA